MGNITKKDIKKLPGDSQAHIVRLNARINELEKLLSLSEKEVRNMDLEITKLKRYISELSSGVRIVERDAL